MVLLFITFLGFLIAFHVSEMGLAQLYMRDDVSSRSWLISKPYCLAMLAAIAEYWIEGALFPGMKTPVGVALANRDTMMNWTSAPGNEKVVNTLF